MIVAILVIGYVLVLRYFDQKNRERDMLRAGITDSGPTDYATLQRTVAQLDERLVGLEARYREMTRRMEVTR